MAKGAFTVCALVLIEGKVLLVRHTYGTAKDRILLPGGYVMEGELATTACERELLEETGIVARVTSLCAMQFTGEQWCAVFKMNYECGTPRSDGYENNEVLLLDPAEAVARPDLTNMSRTLLTAYLQEDTALAMSEYLPASKSRDEYVLFQNSESKQA